jgi:hypothetical protein
LQGTTGSKRWKSDDLMAYISVAVIVSIVVFIKIVIGILSIPLVILLWLYELGSRTVRSANNFLNPEHEN